MSTAAFMITEQYLKKEELVRVAKAILRSQDIREESWIPTETNYKLNEQEASVQAVDEFKLDNIWKYVITEWNMFYWNDVQGWAEAIIEALDNK